MLESFAFTKNPFPGSPEEDHIFWGSPHRRVMALLRNGITSGRGLLCLLGARGTGKTSLLISLAEQLQEQAPLCFIWKPLPADELVLKLVTDLNVPNPGVGRIDQMGALRGYLLQRCREELPSPIVIVDNAESLATNTLEEIRLLNNIETDTRKAIQVILCGREELETRLLQPELRQLRQRLGTVSRLEPLQFEDTCEYFRHRIAKVSSLNQTLFTRESTYLLWRECSGVLTDMHQTSRRTLELVEAAGAQRANLGFVRRALEDLPALRGERSIEQRNRHSFAERATSPQR